MSEDSEMKRMTDAEIDALLGEVNLKAKTEKEPEEKPTPRRKPRPRVTQEFATLPGELAPQYLFGPPPPEPTEAERLRWEGKLAQFENWVDRLEVLIERELQGVEENADTILNPNKGEGMGRLGYLMQIRGMLKQSGA